jgi:hypothetical protein
LNFAGLTNLSEEWISKLVKEFEATLGKVYDGKKQLTKNSFQLEDVLHIMRDWLPNIDML